MKKHITSLVLSAITAISAISATTANANVRTWYTDSEEYKNVIENYEEFDDGGYFSQHGINYKAYYNESEDYVVIIDYPYDYIYYRVPDDENAAKAVGMAMQNPEWKFRSSSKIGGGYVGVSVSLPNSDKAKNIRDAAEFAEKLKGVTELVEFKLVNNILHPTFIPMKCRQLTFAFGDWSAIDSEEFLHYVDKLDIDYSLDFSADYPYTYLGKDTGTFITLIPNTETTIKERIALVKKIEDETGTRICIGAIPESAAPEISGGGIDMANNVFGDANNDSTTTIADAAAIMQAIANPDKYALSAQGEFNADSKGDGLTVDDAVAIQKKLAGIAE